LDLYEGLALLVGVLQVEADDRRHAGPHEIRVEHLPKTIRTFHLGPFWCLEFFLAVMDVF
jgi:hypothetical protein